MGKCRFLLLLCLAFIAVGCFEDVNAVDEKGRTALHRGAKAGDLKVVKALLKKKAKLDLKDKYDWTPLCHAVDGKHVEVAKALIDAGADIFVIIEGCNRTLLHRAARWNDLEMVKLLIEAGCELSAHDSEPFCAGTPVHRAAQCDSVEVMEYFLKEGASADVRSKAEKAPLHFTAGYGNRGALAVAKLLLKNGADVNAKDKNGVTPLHLAAYWGKVELAKLFIKAGAKLDIRNNDGETPKDLASKPDDNERREKAREAVLDLLSKS